MALERKARQPHLRLCSATNFLLHCYCTLYILRMINLLYMKISINYISITFSFLIASCLILQLQLLVGWTSLDLILGLHCQDDFNPCKMISTTIACQMSTHFEKINAINFEFSSSFKIFFFLRKSFYMKNPASGTVLARCSSTVDCLSLSRFRVCWPWKFYLRPIYTEVIE